jgi:AraC-like DNA-binding protein
MAIAMLAVVRAHALEPVFGGLDRAVRFHRILGPSAIALLIVHVIFLALAEFQSGTSIGNVFIPFWSESARSIDIIVFYLLLLLGGVAYDRRRRMSLVRHTLRRGGGADATVSAVARRYGFRSPGRFAVNYRAAFGEPPSTTLRRSLGRTQEANLAAG